MTKKIRQIMPAIEGTRAVVVVQHRNDRLSLYVYPVIGWGVEETKKRISSMKVEVYTSIVPLVPVKTSDGEKAVLAGTDELNTYAKIDGPSNIAKLLQPGDPFDHAEITAELKPVQPSRKIYTIDTIKAVR